MRFVLGGGLNTLLSYCIYWMLLHYVVVEVAYTLSYAATIFSGFAINTYFVFRAPWSWRRFAAFPVIHLINYLAGMIVVAIWVRALELDSRWAPIAATVVTLPLNFLLTRLLITRRH